MRHEIHLSNYNLFVDLFCEPNPVPVKVLMQAAGIIESAEVRLPLCPPSPANLELLNGISERLDLREVVKL